MVLFNRNNTNGCFSARAHWSRGEQRSITNPYGGVWYAFTADTTVIFERINHSIHYGETLVALYYDIYAGEPLLGPHNPLPAYSSGIETPSFLTRAVVSETVIDQVQSVLASELANTDEVIVTLQHLFPEGPVDTLWNTYPAYLHGGDRVLYDILTGKNTNDTRWSELYSVKLVEVTIRSAYNNLLTKDVIVPEECTFVPITDPAEPLIKPLKNCGPGNVKLIVATKLTDRHRAGSFKLNRVYQPSLQSVCE